MFIILTSFQLNQTKFRHGLKVTSEQLFVAHSVCHLRNNNQNLCHTHDKRMKNIILSCQRSTTCYRTPFIFRSLQPKQENDGENKSESVYKYLECVVELRAWLLLCQTHFCIGNPQWCLLLHTHTHSDI